MPSIIEVDTIKNKTGTQNTVLSTDGSGNNTLNANTIKDGSATKTLAEYSSSAWSWGTGVPAGTITRILQSSKRDTDTVSNTTIPGDKIAGTDQDGSGSDWGVTVANAKSGYKYYIIANVNMSPHFSLILRPYTDIGGTISHNWAIASHSGSYVGFVASYFNNETNHSSQMVHHLYTSATNGTIFFGMYACPDNDASTNYINRHPASENYNGVCNYTVMEVVA